MTDTTEATSTVEPVQNPQGAAPEAPEQPHGDAPDSAPIDPPEDPEPAQDKPEIDWKAMSRKHEDRSKALASEVADLRKQLESATSEADKRAARAEAAAEIAASTGVKLRYLTGETREEIEASANSWLEDARSLARVGVVPTQGTGDSAPRVSSYATGADRARARATQTKEKA